MCRWIMLKPNKNDASFEVSVESDEHPPFCFRHPSGRAFWVLLHRGPGIVRIVGRHGPGDFCGLRSEVLLINPALLVHDEGHHSRVTPFSRPGDERKSRNHAAIDEVVILAAG